MIIYFKHIIHIDAPSPPNRHPPSVYYNVLLMLREGSILKKVLIKVHFITTINIILDKLF